MPRHQHSAALHSTEHSTAQHYSLGRQQPIHICIQPINDNLLNNNLLQRTIAVAGRTKDQELAVLHLPSPLALLAHDLLLLRLLTLLLTRLTRLGRLQNGISSPFRLHRCSGVLNGAALSMALGTGGTEVVVTRATTIPNRRRENVNGLFLMSY